MCRRSRASVAVTLIALALMASLGACEGLTDNGAPVTPSGSSGTAGAGGGVVVDPNGEGSGEPTGTGGSLTTPSPAPAGTCGAYPDGPELTATRFEVGSVVPNLTFTREDGTTVSFGDLRCNKNNKILYWAVGGDNCPPCIDTAKAMEIPANTELGSKGLFIMESFNGRRFLVSRSPWVGFRAKTMWPADSDSIGLFAEPATLPYYVQGRISNAIPWTVVIDLETMTVLTTQTRSIVTLRSLLAAAPARP